MLGHCELVQTVPSHLFIISEERARPFAEGEKKSQSPLLFEFEKLRSEVKSQY